MGQIAADQAEGLRRLLAPRHARVVAFTGGAPGVGCSTVSANLAAALARRGRSVLLLSGGGGAALGDFAADWLQASRSDAAEAVEALPDVVAVSAAAALATLPRAAAAERDRLAAGLARLAPAADTVLLDLPPGVDTIALAACLAAHEVVAVVRDDAGAITDGYAMVKVLNRQFGRRRFRVLVNRARGEEHAWAIFGNIARVSARFLDASLDFAGWIPTDQKLHQAGLTHRPVVELFPRSAAAMRLRQLAESMESWPVPAAGADSVADFVRRLAEVGRRVEDFRL